MNLPSKSLVLAAVAVPALLAGCVVPNEKYQALRIENEGLKDQLNRAESDQLAAQRERDALAGQLDRTAGSGQGMSTLIGNKDQQIERLRDENARLEQALDAAMAGQGAVLPPVVVTDLNRFAQQNPGLVEFDADRGIVRFKSDLTFPSGSAQVNPEATAAIRRFADILNNESMSDYELMVAGHTDNVPVANERTRQQHPNNWYLSSHRAISVAEAMTGAGVDKARLAAAGYADQRPVADNATAAGRAQNRRVEVVILPTRAPGAVVQPGGPDDLPTVAPAETTDAAADLPVRVTPLDDTGDAGPFRPMDDGNNK